MAEEDLVTIVDVADPDDPSFRYVKTMKRPLTDEELEKLKPLLKNAGVYRFFKMDLSFSDAPAVKQFLDSVELEDFRRTTDHFKIVQDEMRGVVAGKQVVVNSALIRKAFGLVDDGLNISKPNKKATDLHPFYIKPVHISKCQTKRGINLKHFKSEYGYIGNMARQIQFYCCGLMGEGFINLTQYRAIDMMIRKKLINWNRYLMQNFQDRVRKYRQAPCDLYFGGTLTALIYTALGVNYSMLVPAARPLATSETNCGILALTHTETNGGAGALVEKPEMAEPEMAENGNDESGTGVTPPPPPRRTSARTSTAEKRKAIANIVSIAKKQKQSNGSANGSRSRAGADKSSMAIVKRNMKKKRLQPPRRVTMGKLELLTRFSHKGSDLTEDAMSKLTKMYYEASGIKPRRNADLSYSGEVRLSSDELWNKYEEFCSLEEELLLEHALSKKSLEELLKKIKDMNLALKAKDEELMEKVPLDMIQGLGDTLRAKSSEVLELEAELLSLTGKTGAEEDDVSVAAEVLNQMKPAAAP